MWLIGSTSTVHINKTVFDNRDEAITEAKKYAQRHPQINFFVANVETTICCKLIISEKTGDDLKLSLISDKEVNVPIEKHEDGIVPMEEILASIRRIISEDGDDTPLRP